MKKRVGLVTVHRAVNAGASLQAFALCRAIENLEYTCEIIDYMFENAGGYQTENLLTTQGIASHVQRILLTRSRIRCLNRFAVFQNELPIVPPQFTSIQDIRQTSLNYDTLICGSDQIWSPSLIARGVAEPFYLTFAPDKPRVAYAPSFGVTDIPDEHRERMKQLISDFSSLSAREKRGVEMIRELTGIEAEHVLDPTLLVPAETFDEITVEPDIHQPFIFVFTTQYPKTAAHMELMRAIAEQFHLLIVIGLIGTFHPKWLLEPGTFRFDIGPKEFLGLIRKASFVVTNSYHGTALSIAMRKNFMVIPHFHFNSRMESLLEIFNLQHRQLNDTHSGASASQFMEPIDYLEVDRRLLQERHKSLNFLKRALAGNN